VTLDWERIAAISTAAGAVVSALALCVSAYQTALMRAEMNSFREVNRNERTLDACVSYLISAAAFRSSFLLWTDKVLGDRPTIANDLSAEKYGDLLIARSVEVLESEKALLILGNDSVRSGIEQVGSVRVAAFMMIESGSVGSRQNADQFVESVDDGVEKVTSYCRTEIGMSENA
jgi:uncharacterized protein YycO